MCYGTMDPLVGSHLSTTSRLFLQGHVLLVCPDRGWSLCAQGPVGRDQYRACNGVEARPVFQPAALFIAIGCLIGTVRLWLAEFSW